MQEQDNMNEMTWFREQVKTARYQVSEHVIRSIVTGKVSVHDIEHALLAGFVIEEHRHVSRGVSYLVCANSGGKPVHLVCTDSRNGWLIIVMAYVPAQPVWKTPTRRNYPGDNKMNENLSHCFFCGGGIKEITIGNFDYRLEGKLYVIKKVPAGLCQQCGEKYVEAEVARSINDLISREEYAGTEQVQVIEYARVEEL